MAKEKGRATRALAPDPYDEVKAQAKQATELADAPIAFLRDEYVRPNCAFTRELAIEICRRLALGDTLRNVCMDKHMPDESSVRLWAMHDICGFNAAFAKARELQAHAIAERAVAEGMSAIDNQDAAAARLRFDAARWFAGRMLPKVYGERQVVELEGKVDLVARREGLAEKLQRLAQARPIIDVDGT